MQPRGLFYWLGRLTLAQERTAKALESIDATLKTLAPPEPPPSPVEFIIGPVREQP